MVRLRTDVIDGSSTQFNMMGLVSEQLIGECIEETVSCNAVLEYGVPDDVGRGFVGGACIPFPAVSAAYTPNALSFGISILGAMMSVANMDVVGEGILGELGQQAL